MKVKFFNVARESALKSKHPKYQIGSVLVSNNRIVSIGVNKLSTHPKSKTPYSFQHSEFNCIMTCKAIREYKNLEIYVYRETTEGLAISRPCNHCYDLIKHFGIKKIHYTDFNGYHTIVL